MLNSYEREEIRKGKETKSNEEIAYCYDCEKETPHFVQEGHDGRDSWSHSQCIPCAQEEEDRLVQKAEESITGD